MHYTNQVDINLPVDKVIKLFDDPANLKHWQPGFISMEPINGTPGHEGAKSKLEYQMGKRRIEMIETIEKRNLPDEFSGTYEAKGVFNRVVNRFIPVSENKTRYVAENEFQFSGFMKIMGWIMPGAFKKQSQKYLDMFKEFAENHPER